VHLKSEKVTFGDVNVTFVAHANWSFSELVKYPNYITENIKQLLREPNVSAN